MTIAIGKRTVDLFSSADITFRQQSTGDEVTIYLSNRSWMTNPSDSVAPNRQYIGLLLDNYSFDYSWFKGDAIGGQSSLNRGTLKAIMPDGAHNLEWIFEGGWLATLIVHRMGEVGEDLADMLVRTTACRATRQSSDSFTLEIDLADDGQLLDTSMFIDRLQGLGDAVRCLSGYSITVPYTAALQPTSGFCVTITYRLPSWFDVSSGLLVSHIGASGIGDMWRVRFMATGIIQIESRDSAAVAVNLATSLAYVFDGRWHQVAVKWDGALLTAFHSTRTGGVKAEESEVMTSIRVASGAAWITGDINATLTAHEFIDFAQITLELDANVPSDQEILARMKRSLTEDERPSCEVCLSIDENTGSDLEDTSGNGHDGEVLDDLSVAAPNQWVPTFEGTSDLTGVAKQLCFGRRFNAHVQWTDEANGRACVHARCFRGLVRAYEGAGRRTIGWVKQRFLNIAFDAATKTISYPSRTSVGGASRFDAQPSFEGLVDGQLVDIVSPLNTGTYTVNTLGLGTTQETLTVVEALVNETGVDAFITARGTAAFPVANVTLWHEAGGLVWSPKPEFPASIRVHGDIGAEKPTDDATVHWPEYTPAIMRCILRDWGGIDENDIADNWDNGVDTPIDATVGAYFAWAGIWLDPGRDRKVRDVLDDGADTLYARWGQNLGDDEWDLRIITDPPATTAPIELTGLEILSLERVRSMPPVGGFVLRGVINDVVLDKDQVVGNALAADKAMLQKAHGEYSASPDPTVVAAFPHAETPKAIDTWLRNWADVVMEVQRRYDMLKVEHEVFRLKVVLFGLDKEPMRDWLSITDADFASLASGKNLWGIHMKADDEIVTWTVWG